MRGIGTPPVEHRLPNDPVSTKAGQLQSRKDYAELLAYWLEGKAEPAVFAEARVRIGAEGYIVRESASYGSAVYSGVFCLLALSDAQDWRRGEDIQLQSLEDHHIFPQAWLRRYGIVARATVNSIVNRTLISNETNQKIKDQAPAEYLYNAAVFPSGPTISLLAPHFIGDAALSWMREATNDLRPEDVSACYDEFRADREAAIVSRIRSVCGVPERAKERESAETV